MFSSPTIYHSGSRTVEVLPGESHSAAWAYVTAGGAVPEGYPCARSAGGAAIRRRDHASRRRRPRRLRVPAGIA